MKKFWLIILSLVMTMGAFSGCISDKNGDTESSEIVSSDGNLEESSDGGTEDNGSDSGSSEDGSEDENDGGDTSSDGGSSADRPNGEIVPPITDGGNFDGTV